MTGLLVVATAALAAFPIAYAVALYLDIRK